MVASTRKLRLCLAALVLSGIPVAGCMQASAKTESERHVVLVLVDGLRTEELFGGADERLLSKEAGGVPDPDALRKQYWRESPEARRSVLMPWFWSTLAVKGQVLGNREKGCPVQVANTFWFSYPGYSEMMVGYADPRVDSNDPRPNPNVSVFEWLHGRPGFKGRVAAVGAWDTLAAILNRDRCGFFINAGFEPMPDEGNTQLQLLNRLKGEIPSPWACEPHDAITFYSALEYLKRHQPRAMVITFGETDEFAHEGRYDRYLAAATRTDGFLRTLWETLQSQAVYKERSTLMVATDHGRGSAPEEWKNHSNKHQGSQNVWVALMGPDTPARGERSDGGLFQLAQVAAMVAAAAGEDYAGAVTQAAPVLEGAFSGRPSR